MPIIPEYTVLFNDKVENNVVLSYISLEANSIAHELEQSLADDYKSFIDVKRFLNRYHK